MAAITLDEHRLRIEVVPAKGHSVHGGQVAVAAICRRFGLWDLLRAEPALDPRRDQGRGFAPETMAVQIIVALCCGGSGLELEELNEMRRVLRKVNHDGSIKLVGL